MLTSPFLRNTLLSDPMATARHSAAATGAPHMTSPADAIKMVVEKARTMDFLRAGFHGASNAPATTPIKKQCDQRACKEG